MQKRIDFVTKVNFTGKRRKRASMRQGREDNLSSHVVGEKPRG